MTPRHGGGSLCPHSSIWPHWEAAWDLERAALTWAPVWGGGGCKQEGQVGRLTGAWGPGGRTICHYLLHKVHVGLVNAAGPKEQNPGVRWDLQFAPCFSVDAAV